jgi:hypothetical protein
MTVSNTTAATAAKSLLQEATETPAQTKAEAAKGDQQAVRKLASEQAAQAPEETTEVVNSERGQLDTKA